MQTYINFEIKNISYGWFDVLFKTNEDEIMVTASYAWGNDSPKLFLQILYELLVSPSCNKYVIWDEEPGVYIIFFSKIKNQYNIKIAYSETCHDELFADIRNTTGNFIFHEAQSMIHDLEVIYECYDINFSHLIKTIIRAFEEYETNPEYERNWMSFPYNELNLLKKDIKQIS